MYDSGFCGLHALIRPLAADSPPMSLLPEDWRRRILDFSASSCAMLSSAGVSRPRSPLGLAILLVFPSLIDERAPRKNGALLGFVGGAMGLFRC